MKKVLLKLNSLKDQFSGNINKYSNQITFFSITLITAFLITFMSNVDISRERLDFIKENESLVREIMSLKHINSQQDIMLFQQRKIIYDLERFKKSILEGNYTSHGHENLKQTKSQVVGKSKRHDLGF